MKKTLILQAPAKINICLWVKEKRSDGYHEIASLMQTLTLSDTITLQDCRTEGIHIECDDPAVPKGAENLVHKAACLILERFNIPPSIIIRIEKRIPIAAGLAGGSTDAAAVMAGMVRMYEKMLPMVELMTLSQKIGSDVPFVMHGGLAIASGRGENLSFHEPPKPSFFVVIAVPKKVSVSTKWAYENYAPGENSRKEELFNKIFPCYKKRDIESLKNLVFNDLESVTLQRYPEVQEIKETLLEDGNGVVLMSGSGPSVFGLFEDRSSAVKAASRLNQEKVNV
ncbi:4-(cytidine 5'-diphospho)-2-C-methyl-D-erythritol kinase, partial [bacterium]|nr:4-(cytidine 5'-diphospho)-2-C-methyl-D-erythritol kinase [bacterium]